MDKKKEIVSLNAEVANFDLEEVTIEELEHRLELAIASSPALDQNCTNFTCDQNSTDTGGTKGWS